MSDEMVSMMAEAQQRGARSLRTEPRARAARYDRRTGRVVVELTNGCSFAFPARMAQGLERYHDEDRFGAWLEPTLATELDADDCVPILEGNAFKLRRS